MNEQNLVIEELYLESHRRQGKGNALSLMNYFSSFEIIEDIFSNTMYGTLILNEVRNVVSSPVEATHSPGPIIGNEKITIVLKESLNQSRIKLQFRVYTIASRFLLNTKTQQTVLKLISEEMLTDASMKVSRTFKDKKYSDVVFELLKREIKTRKQPNVENTNAPKNFVLPNWNPYKAINWMAGRSISEKYIGASYLFFETMNNPLTGDFQPSINYLTLEGLYDRGPVKTLKTTIANLIDPVQNPQEYSSFQESRINKYDFVRSFNVLENIHSGMYANRLVIHDILNKKIESLDFNYLGTYDSFKHLNPDGRLVSSLTAPFTSEANANYVVSVKNNSYYSGSNQDESAKSYLRFRKSQLNQLGNVRIVLNLPGDGSLSVGQCVDVFITSPKASEDIGGYPYDHYYSGKFLITCVKHVITAESPGIGVFSTIIEVSKDTLNKNPLSEGALP